MAFLACRTSRGKKYWSIVESVRVNGKPKHVIIEYLGPADKLLGRLRDSDEMSLKSYAHGDTAALLSIAAELEIIEIINKHVPAGKNGKKPMRDGLTVGASFLLAAAGRACRPTSKMGWRDWAKTTSLEFCLKSSFKKLDSQHFWDQMNFLPTDKIQAIEEEIVARLVRQYDLKPDTLLFDTSNFFTFIDSGNDRCTMAQRGKNKQKRNDLRQIGLALLVTRKDQFPLFHKTYQGNLNDITVFGEVLDDLVGRIKKVFHQLDDITLVFDKGNNSKANFKKLSGHQGIHYVCGLVPSYFKELIEQANERFETVTINGEEVPVYRVKKEIWGEQRTCAITVSNQLKEGQIRGIYQHLQKKYKALDDFKRQIENPKRRKIYHRQTIEKRLVKIISGQFVEQILKYEFIESDDRTPSFTYYLDYQAFEKLKQEVLGRRILATDQHEWTSEEIILAYRGQAKVEYAFRNFKNPYHLAVRPQYHWTDQKIAAHVLICVIGYLLTTAAYAKARRAGYKHNIGNFMEELKSIRLASRKKKKSNKIRYQLETIPPSLKKVAKVLGLTDENIHPNIKLSVYN
jgi:transposase